MTSEPRQDHVAPEHGPDMPMTGRDLAAGVIQSLPKRSFRQDMRMLTVDVSHRTDCGRCPRCGRALPHGSLGPAFQSLGMGAMGFPTTAQERIAACLVDGGRSRAAEDLPLEDIILAASDIHVALIERGWRHWSKRLGAALMDTSNATNRAEGIGQALEVLRRFGPLALEPAPELEVLVTSLARHWPTVDVAD